MLLKIFLCFGMFFSVARGDEHIENFKKSNILFYQPIPFLTNVEIERFFYRGYENGATHMLIVWDTYDIYETYDFVVFSYPDQDVNDLIDYNTAPGLYRVSAVFAMHLDFVEQLDENYGHPWHPEYSAGSL